MNVTDTILARRSVRSYLPEPVAAPLIVSLLESAVQAPSAMNMQPWQFAVVQDATRLKRWSDLAKQRLLDSFKDDAELSRYAAQLRDPAFNIFHDAGTLVVIGARHTRFSHADCWLAAENLMLSARAAGLGSCCIGFALDVLNTEAVKTEIHMPLEAEVVAAIVLGYTRQFPEAPARAAPKVTVWLTQAAAGATQGRPSEDYARAHPAGFLASRAAPGGGEHVGHPHVHDAPGFGPEAARRPAEGEHEWSLASPLPEALLSRLHARKK